MNWGAISIVLSCAALVISTAAFFVAARGRRRFESLAVRSYYYFTGLTIVASLILLYHFLAKDYSYQYVYEYSSSDLPLFYLISAFWGGQEGTYLLWLLFLSLMGFFIIRRGRQYREWAMFFYGLIGLFFGLIMIVLSPFAKLPVPQPEGAGLNPLLQDPWMVVHPPVIFLGYAVVAIPCVIALAALVKGDFRDWLKITLPAVVFGSLALAAGNIMGGFWAYKTLGWGGYWAWDPVENSSFIPWLTALALLHGMLVGRVSGALLKTNLFLAITTFWLVVYGTFLTRSGVLADFSVHSFVDLGVNAYLVSFMVGFAVLSLAIFVARTRIIKAPPAGMAVTSQEFALLVAVWLLLLITTIVLVGTSWPLITTFLASPGTVDTGVYTRLSFPITVILSLVIGISPLLLWKGGNPSGLLKKLILPAALAVAATILAVIAGVGHYSYVIFVFAAALAFFGNLMVFLRNLPERLGASGPQIAHVGLALMLIGILGSSAYSENKEVVIDRGQTESAYQLDIAYLGTEGELTTSQNEILLAVVDGQDIYEARPRLYWSERMQGFMKKPYIKRHLFYDFYFAPEQVQDLGAQNGIEISRGEEVELGDLAVRFKEFSQAEHTHGNQTDFGAVLEFHSDQGSQIVIPALAFDSQNQLAHIDDTVIFEGDSLTVRLEKIYADRAAILLSVEGLTPQSPPDRLVMEVSKKPTMNLLWGGSIILTLGTLVSFRRRWKGASPDSQ